MSSGRLIDADTLDLPGHGPARFKGVDAPENGQVAIDANGRAFDAGKAATEALAAYLRYSQKAGWKIVIEEAATGRDRYGRTLVSVRLERGREREDVCAWMVANGWAVAEYGPPDYSHEEDHARRNRIGLWAGQWQRPSEWRAAGRRKPASSPRRRSQSRSMSWSRLLRSLFRGFKI